MNREGRGDAGPGSVGSNGGGSPGTGTVAPKPGSRLWPILITIGLALVMLVNGIFIYIAVKGADDVVPSYNTEER